MFAGSIVGAVGGVLYTALLLAAAVVDVKSRRIPNRLVAVLLVSGVAYSLAVAGAPGPLRGLAGVAIGLAIWLPFHLFGWVGAGDVKLFAAAGAWLGPARTVEGALLAALAGAVLALIWMLRVHGVKRTTTTLSAATVMPSLLAAEARLSSGARTLPYGVALALGAIAAGWLPRPLLFQ